MADEPTEAKKQADRPHHVSIILSVLAVVIASLSWWEAHSSRVVIQGSNRAVAYVTDLQEIKEKLEVGEDRGLRFKILVKNLGKSTASPVLSSFGAVITDTDPEEKDYNAQIFEQLWADLPPGYQKEREATQIAFGLPDEKVTIPKSPTENLYILGVLNYRDEASGEWFRQKWCFIVEHKPSGTIRPCFDS